MADRGPPTLSIEGFAASDPLLAIETSCDDTCAAVVTPDGEILSNVISSQARFHERYGGVVPEIASRHHLELVNAVVDEALATAGVGLRDLGAVAATSRPGPDRGPAGRPVDGEGARRRRRAAVRGGRPPARARGGELPRAGPARAALPVPDRKRRPHAAGERRATRRVRAARLDPRRRRRRGARQGRAPDGPRLSRAAPRSTAWRARATRSAFDFPVGMRRGDSLDFSFSGLKTALVYKVRELGPDQTLARRADLAASFQRAVVESLMVKLEQALERTGAPPAGDRGRRGRELRAALAGGGGVRRARPRAEDPAAGALHRQRGDDRVRGEVRAAGPVS